MGVVLIYFVLLFLQDLEKHTGAFVEQARLLATWDSAVLSNRHALLDLEADIMKVHRGQQALERQLGMIETHQKVRTLLAAGPSALSQASAPHPTPAQPANTHHLHPAFD
jgi:hypothetical protein